jgi:hypothetical protein
MARGKFSTPLFASESFLSETNYKQIYGEVKIQHHTFLNSSTPSPVTSSEVRTMP